ncbi:MAG: hypothetical protein J5695_05825 [Bacteroidales bacterium]|nr:hypothetical protein [Bacteroidales bacterium]MBO4566726.1 hypothetical protein [Bacteroidales bacterium]
MASLTNQEIEQMKKQLEEKQQEVRELYNNLVEAGAFPIDEDELDLVSGGVKLITDRLGFF